MEIPENDLLIITLYISLSPPPLSLTLKGLVLVSLVLTEITGNNPKDNAKLPLPDQTRRD